MADMLPPLIVEIQLDIAKLKQQNEALQNQLKNIGNAANQAVNPFSRLGGAARNLASQFGLILSAGAIIGLIKQSGHAAVEEAKSFAILSKTMTAVTGASKDVIDATDKQIGRMALMAGLTDDSLRPAFNIFLRSTKDTSKALYDLQLAMDISAGTGRGLHGVSMMLSRALTGNLGALNRLVPGIKDAKDPIAELQNQFGGMAKKVAQTDPYMRLNAVLDEMKESIGSAVVPAISGLADWLTQILPTVQQFFKELNDPATETGRKWKSFTDAIAGAWQWLTKNFDLVVKLAGAFIVFKTTLGLVKTAMEVATAKQWLLNIAMNANPVGMFILLIGGLAAAYALLAGNITTATNAQYGYNGATADYIAGGGKPIVGREAQFTGIQVKPGDPFGSRYAALEAYGKAQQAAGLVPGGDKVKIKSPGVDPIAEAKAALADAKTNLKQVQDSYASAVTQAYTAFNKATYAAEAERTRALAELEKSHAKQVESITKDFTGRLQGIIQQSMDQLRNAFKQVASVDVGNIFASAFKAGNVSQTVFTQVKNGLQAVVSWWGQPSSGGGVSGLLEALQSRLAQSKELVQNAGKLSGAGFSQTFIEQVVAQGGEVGNEMARQILAASPETQQQLQDLFAETEATASTGMDGLAKAIYDKNGLATDELKKLYKTTQEELAQALVDEQAAYTASMTEINDTYAKTLADANTALNSALNNAGVALNTALDKIEADLNKKLALYKGKLGSLAGAIGIIRNAIGGSYVNAAGDSVLPFADAQSQANATTQSVTFNNTINAQGPVNPTDVSDMVVNGIKYNLPYITAVM